MEQKWSNLEEKEWEQLSAIRDLLEPFDAYTTLTSGQQYTTSDQFILCLDNLEAHLKACLTVKHQKIAAKVLLEELQRRFGRFRYAMDDNHIPFYVAGCYLHLFNRRLLEPREVASAKKYIKEVYVKYFEVCMGKSFPL